MDRKINTTLPTVYAIWVDSIDCGPLSGQSGFLSENGSRLYYHERKEAEQKLHDLQERRVSKSPAVSYSCVSVSEKDRPGRSMAQEDIDRFHLQPGFSPAEHELLSRSYGNTGGGCMVGTASFYLPSLDKTVWVNCNDEGVTITSADYIWNEDHSESWERYEDVLLFTAGFQNTQPEELGAWLPMVRETLAYTIEQQAAQGKALDLPDCWRSVEQETLSGPAMVSPC